MSRKRGVARVLHLDAFSGASGNMFMGALLDLGLSRKALLEGLAPLELDFKLVVKKVLRSGFAARYVDVRVPVSAQTSRAEAKAHKRPKAKEPHAQGHTHTHPHTHDHTHGHDHPHTQDYAHGHDHTHEDTHEDAREPSHAHEVDLAHSHAHGRHYGEIRDLIDRAGLDAGVKRRALLIFEALAVAEAKVHGTSVEAVHFHEVGAVDAIVDVVAAAVGLAELGITRVTCSPIAIGYGTIDSDHGMIPLPAPATLELLVGMPTVPAGVEWETLTPTGAAILKIVVDEYGSMPAMTIERVGYGAGNDRPGRLPNVLRATLGKATGTSLSTDRVVCLETNLDDLVPEHFDYLMERLFEGGALDVALQHLQMKKNRPGFLVRVLARPIDRDALARILFAESTAIGVRHAEWDRLVLERENRRLETEWGTASVKLIRGPDGSLECSPEYDDCKRLARKSGLSLREVVQRIRDQARIEFGVAAGDG